MDEATLLAGIFAEERIRAKAEAGRGERERPPGRRQDEPAEIGMGPAGVTIKGTSEVTNDRTDEEIARADAWARKQGWTVQR